MFSYTTKITLFAICGVLSVLPLIYADDAVNPAKPRECYACDGINCQRTSRVNVTATCTDLLDICVTVFDGFAVVAKGCYLDMPETQREKCDSGSRNPECFKCFGQLCNNKGRSDFKCIECDSSDDTRCGTDTSAMTAVQCPIPTAPNSYCYVRATGLTSVRRGCFVHQQEQQDCVTDSACSLCLSGDGVGDACNSYKLRGDVAAGVSSTRGGALSLSATVAAFLVAHFLK